MSALIYNRNTVKKTVRIGGITVAVKGENVTVSRGKKKLFTSTVRGIVEYYPAREILEYTASSTYGRIARVAGPRESAVFRKIDIAPATTEGIFPGNVTTDEMDYRDPRIEKYKTLTEDGRTYKRRWCYLQFIVSVDLGIPWVTTIICGRDTIAEDRAAERREASRRRAEQKKLEKERGKEKQPEPSDENEGDYTDFSEDEYDCEKCEDCPYRNKAQG